MRRIRRLNISQASLLFLKNKRAAKVARKRSPETQIKAAKALWPLKKNKAFDEIDATLERMSSGLKRCMYCEDCRGSAIEHFWPMSLYPLKAFEWTNYLYSCAPCNTSKSDQFLVDKKGLPVLIDPTSADPADDPMLHIELTPRTGRFRARTRRGGESVKVYGLHRGELVEGRRNAWLTLELLLATYAQKKALLKDKEAEEIKKVVRQHPFSGVFVHLIAIAQGPGAHLVNPDCLAAIKACPEIKGWI